MTYRINLEKRSELKKKYFIKFVKQLTPGILLLSFFIWIDSYTNDHLSMTELLGFGIIVIMSLIYMFKTAFQKQLDYKLITVSNRIESHIGKTVQYIHWKSVIIRHLNNGDIVLEDKGLSKRKRWNGIGKITVYAEFENFDQLLQEIEEHVKPT